MNTPLMDRLNRVVGYVIDNLPEDTLESVEREDLEQEILTTALELSATNKLFDKNCAAWERKTLAVISSKLEERQKSEGLYFSPEEFEKLFGQDRRGCQLEETFSRLFETLSEREREVAKLRFGFYGEPVTIEETAARLGVTRERIRQIEAKTLRKFRHPSRSSHLVVFLDR